MLYLLFQMALYMLVTLLLGIWLGWLLWRKGYITKIQEVMGLHPDVVADVPANAAELEADYKRLRDQNAKLASDLANANSQRNTLQNDLDECRASKSKAASVAPAAARVAAKPAPKAASKAAAAPVSSGGGTKPARAAAKLMILRRSKASGLQWRKCSMVWAIITSIRLRTGAAPTLLGLTTT